MIQFNFTQLNIAGYILLFLWSLRFFTVLLRQGQKEITTYNGASIVASIIGLIIILFALTIL